MEEGGEGKVKVVICLRELALHAAQGGRENERCARRKARRGAIIGSEQRGPQWDALPTLLSLWRPLSSVLGCHDGRGFPLLSAAWMRVGEGAVDQPLHRDVHRHDRLRHCESPGR